MKKLSASIFLLVFIASFIKLFLAKTPVDISLVGSCAAALIAGFYCYISFGGEAFMSLLCNVRKFTLGKRLIYFSGLIITILVVINVVFKTQDATITLPPLKLYGISLIIVLIIAILTRLLFIRMSKNQEEIDEVISEEIEEDTLVSVAKFNDHVKAHIAKGMLETNGIEAVIYGESLQGFVNAPQHLIPITVMVKKSDKETAIEVLSDMKEYLDI